MTLRLNAGRGHPVHFSTPRQAPERSAARWFAPRAGGKINIEKNAVIFTTWPASGPGDAAEHHPPPGNRWTGALAVVPGCGGIQPGRNP